MKLFASLIALTGAAFANADVTKIEQIVGGVLMGAIHAEGFDDITNCINDGKAIFADSKDAYQHFKEGGAGNVIDGIKDVGQILSEVKSGMQDCSKLSADWVKLGEMVAVFTNPASFAYHAGKDIILNGAQIFGDVKTATNAYEAQNWGGFGYAIGEAAAKTLLGKDAPITPIPADIDLRASPNAYKAAEVLKGAIEPFGAVGFNINDLLQCVLAEDTGILGLETAFEKLSSALSSFNLVDIVEGVLGAVAALKEMESGLAYCEGIFNSTSMDLDRFHKSQEIMAHPEKYTKLLTEDLAIHSAPIMWKAQAAVDAYRKIPQDLEGYGRNLGEIVYYATSDISEESIKSEKD